MFFVVKLIEWLPNLIILNNQGESTSNIMRIVEAALLGIVLGTISEAIVVYGVMQYLRKDTISLQKALELVIRRFAPLVVLAILLPILWVAGVVLLVVPCLILIAVTYVTIPAFQIEGLGPVASIKRSARLTKGYRWRILALSFITGGVEVSVDQG